MIRRTTDGLHGEVTLVAVLLMHLITETLGWRNALAAFTVAMISGTVVNVVHRLAARNDGPK